MSTSNIKYRKLGTASHLLAAGVAAPVARALTTKMAKVTERRDARIEKAKAGVRQHVKGSK